MASLHFHFMRKPGQGFN